MEFRVISYRFNGENDNVTLHVEYQFAFSVKLTKKPFPDSVKRCSIVTICSTVTQLDPSNVCLDRRKTETFTLWVIGDNLSVKDQYDMMNPKPKDFNVVNLINND